MHKAAGDHFTACHTAGEVVILFDIKWQNYNDVPFDNDKKNITRQFVVTESFSQTVTTGFYMFVTLY